MHKKPSENTKPEVLSAHDLKLTATNGPTLDLFMRDLMVRIHSLQIQGRYNWASVSQVLGNLQTIVQDQIRLESSLKNTSDISKKQVNSSTNYVSTTKNAKSDNESILNELFKRQMLMERVGSSTTEKQRIPATPNTNEFDARLSAEVLALLAIPDIKSSTPGELVKHDAAIVDLYEEVYAKDVQMAKLEMKLEKEIGNKDKEIQSLKKLVMDLAKGHKEDVVEGVGSERGMPKEKVELKSHKRVMSPAPCLQAEARAPTGKAIADMMDRLDFGFEQEFDVSGKSMDQFLRNLCFSDLKQDQGSLPESPELDYKLDDWLSTVTTDMLRK